MSAVKIGSLFSGYAGLDMAVEQVTGGRTVWFSENDPAPSRVLAHHWPDVPNLGALEQINWADVEPVDIITGGFPCQDLSLAGRQAGMHEGSRSGLWSHMATAIETIRPRLVVAENVRGLLSGKAHSRVERCPGCVDGGPGGHVRALGVVLGDLARVGYDAQWYGLRASDVGAPHQRFRVFVVAENTDSRIGTGWRRTTSGGAAGGGPRPHLGGRDRVPAAQPAGIGRAERWAEPVGQQGGSGAAVGGAGVRAGGPANLADADGAGLEIGGVVGRHPGTERPAAGGDDPDSAAADTGSLGRVGGPGVLGAGWDQGVGGQAGDHLGDGAALSVDWGRFEPAIRRWESVIGRSAPAPTVTGPRGGQRLSPYFVEFMMGLPEGHVTAAALSLTRNEQIKILGNGVVPQQAMAALRTLLPHTSVVVSEAETASNPPINVTDLFDEPVQPAVLPPVAPAVDPAVAILEAAFRSRTVVSPTPIKGIEPWIATPESVELDLVEEINSAIMNHPRSQQKTIGPSEIGIPCTRRLLHKLNGDVEPERGVPWLPILGTAMHTWLAGVMENAIGQYGEDKRYLIEHRVMVGQIAGQDIWGSSDLFDTATGFVIDWKLIGKTPMQDYRRKGPRAEYRTQAHLYGRGFALAGHTVNNVMLAFLPRNEISLAARYFWSEPYDERIAIAALDRATALVNLIKAVGIDAALAMYGPCDDTRLCPYCFAPAALRLPTTSTRELFSGSLKGISA